MKSNDRYMPPLEEISFSAVRSRGPGGQNVNKVSSAAHLTWNYVESPSLSDHKKELIADKLPNQINKRGEVYIFSDEFRDLERNKQRCLEKLAAMLAKAFHREKPRKKTRPTKASKIRRVESKKHRGEIKKNRRKIDT